MSKVNIDNQLAPEDRAMYEREGVSANPDIIKPEYYNDINQEFGNADVSGKDKPKVLLIVILTHLFSNPLQMKRT